MAVIQRIAHMGQTNPEVIKQVEEGLKSRMVSETSQQFQMRWRGECGGDRT